MDSDKRADLLKDEYVMLQQFYEEIDGKGLNIKNWSVTVALAAIGAGFIYGREVLLVGAGAALVFWYLEAYWRGLSHFFATRIRQIEAAFASGDLSKEVPLQVYNSWNKEYERVGDRTLRYMFKVHVLIPHVLVALFCLAAYFFDKFILP